MLRYEFESFGVDRLRVREVDPPTPGPGELLVRTEALSLNYRDLLIVEGLYNPKLALPATPISDGCGVVQSVGSGVDSQWIGRRVIGSFVSGWEDGPYRAEYLGTTLGTPVAGFAADKVVLAERSVVVVPDSIGPHEASTLPVAGLTAWSALVTEGGLGPPRTSAADRAGGTDSGHSRRVLTLGTGGVSIFAVQIAVALGIEVWVVTSSATKLERVIELGARGFLASHDDDWTRPLTEAAGEDGFDVVVETVGAATLDRSLRVTRAGGRVALLGALDGMKAHIDTAPIVMKRIRVQGILVDSTAALREFVRFVDEEEIAPVVDRTYSRDSLPEALSDLRTGQHFGKIVIEWTTG